jgi:hypothetical protein
MPPSLKNPFEKYAGVLPAFSSREAINKWVRDLRDEEIDSAPNTPGNIAKKRVSDPSLRLVRFRKKLWWALPVFFGPRTLRRTWGTRPDPNWVLLGD